MAHLLWKLSFLLCFTTLGNRSMALNTLDAVNSTRTDRIEHENRYATRVKSPQVGATKLQEVKKSPDSG